MSRTRAPALVHRLAAVVGAELVPMGSAGYKIAAVIRGETDAYVHAGGQHEWDSAAPVAVAHAAGLHASRIDGLAAVQPARPVFARLDRLPPELADAAPRGDRQEPLPRTSAMTIFDYHLSQLDLLESEAIHIMREVAAEFERPVLLFSGGKDSITALRLAGEGILAGPDPIPGPPR